MYDTMFAQFTVLYKRGKLQEKATDNANPCCSNSYSFCPFKTYCTGIWEFCENQKKFVRAVHLESFTPKNIRTITAQICILNDGARDKSEKPKGLFEAPL